MEPKNVTTQAITMGDERVAQARIAESEVRKFMAMSHREAIAAHEAGMDLRPHKDLLIELALAVLSQWR